MLWILELGSGVGHVVSVEDGLYYVGMIALYDELFIGCRVVKHLLILQFIVASVLSPAS